MWISSFVGHLFNISTHLFFYFLKKILFILFLDREEGWERGKETSVCGWLSRAPYWGCGPQPRHVLWLGIKPVTLWFTGRVNPLSHTSQGHFHSFKKLSFVSFTYQFIFLYIFWIWILAQHMHHEYFPPDYGLLFSSPFHLMVSLMNRNS